MSDPKNDFAKVLAAAAADYQRQLPQKIADIDRLWAELASNGMTPGKLDELVRMTHNIAGSARVFGLAEASEAARALEHCLGDFGQGHTPAEKAAYTRAEALIAALQQSVPTSR